MISSKQIALIVAFTGSLSPTVALAQDITRLGGNLTSNFPPNAALELPSPNIGSEELRLFHLSGHTDFHGSFAHTRVREKLILGPNFNHNSCGGCHIKNGKGPIRFSKTPDAGSPMLIKLSIKGLASDGSPRNVPHLGEQLQDHTIKGKIRFDIKLRWKEVTGSYPDGTPYKLRKPLLSFKLPDAYSKYKLVTSMRMTPSVIGMGLLEAVADSDLIAMSDEFDSNADGISGKVSIVPDREHGGQAIGRFGFRASHPSVKQQTAAAFFHDMGLSNDLFHPANKEPEISTEILNRTVFYLQAPGIPPARDQDNPDVIAGKLLFQQVNCSGCHKLTLRTGDSSVVEVANQEFHPFTDLLLHDMGRDLADKRPEFSATGQEWRTTPLWGLGLTGILSTSRPGFLHDGRARTIEEAILWHGGEGATSRNAFKALNKAEREQVIKFLKSL